ncbi:uncharacterized protein LY89DRAFT_720584 [Mollisia scopiformis]|uniref:Tc1-like transposase DDE domain-containing protein n=1 Tax=Mollisia scopiformis TaxID=149040 RepID=A0A194X221_MOLSC|nr:uncharacterized protein LY89DRAFT_720584 [Mollisia scopiformis]KUJ14223.1 hypothetical protein LY89DRAFT_720584 [Mollisia scopiformis]
MGILAYRHTRGRSGKLGKPSKVTKAMCKKLVDPARNPVRNQPYEAQIAYHKIPCKKRQLQRKLKEYTNSTHIDPSAQQAPRILRELGTQYDDENIIERGERKGVKFYVAAWVTWFDKAKKLEFYNNEEEYEEQPLMPTKPRRRPTTETPEEYQARLTDWEAQKPHKVDVKPQEDGDPSHGMRKRGLAQQLKENNWIVNLKHPAQSPDLNPIEAIWNIIKQRLRHRIFQSEEEIKEALQEEWSKVTITEVRKRISQMPRRCARLINNGGKPIKTALW